GAGVSQKPTPRGPPRPPPLQVRPDLLPPAVDGHLVPLDGSFDRHLGSPAQFFEQLADVVLVVADAKFLRNDLGDAGGRPHLPAEAVGLRPVPEEFRDQALVGRGELGRAARGGASEQCLGAAVAGAGRPPADAPPPYTPGP